VIAYFDTSAVVPLIINEPSSDQCNRVWNESSRVVSVRLLYPEARAALAKAERMGRITRTQLVSAIAELDSIMAEVDHIEVTAELATVAGHLAQEHGLRGYDAVHFAAVDAVADGDLVLVTGDADLAAAAVAIGIPVASIQG
jgi:predicted nucleic acid-binding protein